jgi:hypothetical protein
VKAAVVTANVADNHLGRTLKTAEQREENIIREVIVPFPKRQIARAERKSQSREELTMWSRLYRNHVIMAFPSYDTIANAWAPQADINWFAGSSHDSKFVRFSKRCTTEEEAVTWALRRSEVWVDNRLQRLSRAILPGHGRRIDMIEAAKTHLGKVTPKQPVRARSSGRRMLQGRMEIQP